MTDAVEKRYEEARELAVRSLVGMEESQDIIEHVKRLTMVLVLAFLAGCSRYEPVITKHIGGRDYICTQGANWTGSIHAHCELVPTPQPGAARSSPDKGRSA